jgi:hypothetical protein
VTARAHAPQGAMGWQERIWEKVSRAGDWPKQMMEIVCMLTALPFFLSALIYDYFPFCGCHYYCRLMARGGLGGPFGYGSSSGRGSPQLQGRSTGRGICGRIDAKVSGP